MFPRGVINMLSYADGLYHECNLVELLGLDKRKR